MNRIMKVVSPLAITAVLSGTLGGYVASAQTVEKYTDGKGGEITVTSGPNVVLTPTALYGMIEKLEVKHSKTLKVLISHQKRIRELERKLAGVQKQVTVLHGKKADK